MKIFAYGSNMSFGRIKGRTPSVKKIATVHLKSYSLAFNKLSKDGSSKANIVPDLNGTGVWGVLYDIDDAEKRLLDMAEGLGKGYNSHTVTVYEDDIPYSAIVYVAEPQSTVGDLSPYDWYMDLVLIGARQNNLPEYYLRQLEKVAVTKDEDADRRAKNTYVANE